jgi:DNA-binding CsgD family transcriptional regulator
LLTSGKGKFPMAGEDASKFVASRIRGSRLEILDDFGAGLFTLEPGTPAGVLLMDDFFGKLPADDKAATQTKAALQDGLSQREVEVLRLLAAGRSNQQIADELVISLNTVRRHVSNVFDKTGVANRTEASVYARDHGIA